MFSTILRNLREAAQETQRELAKAVYVSPSAISQYENGRSQPSRGTLEALAKHFNVSTDYLLGTSNTPELEELMNKEFCNGVTVSGLVEKCMRIPMKGRETVLTIVDALIPDQGKGGSK